MAGVTWSTDPTDLIRAVEEEIDKQYRKFVVNVWNNITVLSPVDTGRYRRSHVMSIGSPSHSTNGTGNIIASVSVGNFPVIYIQNNLPYAMALENGHSRQAPTGVYQNAFNSALASMG